jgi:hypothetical protein
VEKTKISGKPPLTIPIHAVFEGKIMVLRGNMYHYDLKKKQRLDEAIWDEYEHFKAKFGYSPEYAVVRAEEVVKGEYPVQVKNAERTFMPPPSHFILCPIIKRSARYFSGVRKSCKR